MSLSDAFGPWHEFYMLLGTASATMVALLFVAASVASGVFSTDRPAALRMFLSASVVHFGGILAVCLLVLAPLHSWEPFGALVFGCGAFGLGYYILTWIGAVRDGLSKAIGLDDRCWYAVFPVIGYLCEAGSGIALIVHCNDGAMALAGTMVILLIVGIHNAWDITIWTITRKP